MRQDAHRGLSLWLSTRLDARRHAREATSLVATGRAREFYDQVQFRVWPDGTVQAVEDGEPYSHMSDDYAVVWAYDEDEARSKA